MVPWPVLVVAVIVGWIVGLSFGFMARDNSECFVGFWTPLARARREYQRNLNRRTAEYMALGVSEHNAKVFSENDMNKDAKETMALMREITL